MAELSNQNGNHAPVRERVELKSGKASMEESYYLSNEVGSYEELAEAGFSYKKKMETRL